MTHPDDTRFRELYPFASHFFEHGDHQQHYLDEGEGSPVVMLHGNPTWSFFYRHLVQGLSDTHRCIVPDHMGCGFSDKPQDYNYTLQTHVDNLDALLAKTVPDGLIDLVMHDWGGIIGFTWATRHPERIRRLVVTNTAAFRSREIPLRINLCRIPLLGDIAIRGFNGFARCATFMTTVKPLDDEVKEAYLKPYDSWANRIATLRFVQDIPMSPRAQSWPVLVETEEKLETLTDKPMLLQWGAQDWCFTIQFYEEFRRRFPDASCNVYNDAGHYLYDDAHDRIVPRIRGFLAD